jgi:glutamate synthase (NADPH/NADH) large chain
MLSGEITKKYGARACKRTRSSQVHRLRRPELRRVPHARHHLDIEGDANDYVGKGLSGGRIIVRTRRRKPRSRPRKTMIVGNVAFYGASAGQAYFRGVAGERFAVRNSGATVVVEGIGDNGCEYMTGGNVVVIGAPAATSPPACPAASPMCSTRLAISPQRCNMAMVDLEPVPEEDDLMREAPSSWWRPRMGQRRRLRRHDQA